MALANKSDMRPVTRMRVVMVIGFYMFAALVMVFVNKAVLNNSPDLPFTFLFIQMCMSVVLLHVSSAVYPNHVEIPTFDKPTIKALLPVITTGVIGLAFNTLCLKNVDTSFFIVARGLALPFTIIVTSTTSAGLPRPQVLVAAAIVTAGFLFGINTSTKYLLPTGWSNVMTNVGFHSIIYGIMSSFTLALHAVLVKSAQNIVGGSVTKLSYYTETLSAILLLPLILGNGEHRALFSAANRDWSAFIAGCLVTGFFGFLLGISAILSIKVTSPVAHMFSSAARSVLQTLLGIYFFGEVVTGNNVISIALITFGALYYTYIQSSASHKITSPSLTAPIPLTSRTAPPIRPPQAAFRVHGPKISMADVEKGNLIKARSGPQSPKSHRTLRSM